MIQSINKRRDTMTKHSDTVTKQYRNRKRDKRSSEIINLDFPLKSTDIFDMSHFNTLHQSDPDREASVSQSYYNKRDYAKPAFRRNRIMHISYLIINDHLSSYQIPTNTNKMTSQFTYMKSVRNKGKLLSDVFKTSPILFRPSKMLAIYLLTEFLQLLT